MRNDFYVYAYLREDGTPYYVGKGCGRRAFRDEGKNCTKPPKERIVFLQENLEEDFALAYEMDYISIYGRQCDGSGILRNLSEGGEMPPLCKGHSEETKRKIRESNKKRAETRDFTYLKGHKKTITPALLEGRKQGAKKAKRGANGQFVKKVT